MQLEDKIRLWKETEAGRLPSVEALRPLVRSASEERGIFLYRLWCQLYRSDPERKVLILRCLRGSQSLRVLEGISEYGADLDARVRQAAVDSLMDEEFFEEMSRIETWSESKEDPPYVSPRNSPAFWLRFISHGHADLPGRMVARFRQVEACPIVNRIFPMLFPDPDALREAPPEVYAALPLERLLEIWEEGLVSTEILGEKLSMDALIRRLTDFDTQALAEKVEGKDLSPSVLQEVARDVPATFGRLALLLFALPEHSGIWRQEPFPKKRMTSKGAFFFLTLLQCMLTKGHYLGPLMQMVARLFPEVLWMAEVPETVRMGLFRELDPGLFLAEIEDPARLLETPRQGFQDEEGRFLPERAVKWLRVVPVDPFSFLDRMDPQGDSLHIFCSDPQVLDEWMGLLHSMEQIARMYERLSQVDPAMASRLWCRAITLVEEKSMEFPGEEEMPAASLWTFLRHHGEGAASPWSLEALHVWADLAVGLLREGSDRTETLWREWVSMENPEQAVLWVCMWTEWFSRPDVAFQPIQNDPQSLTLWDRTYGRHGVWARRVREAGLKGKKDAEQLKAGLGSYGLAWAVMDIPVDRSDRLLSLGREKLTDVEVAVLLSSPEPEGMLWLPLQDVDSQNLDHHMLHDAMVLGYHPDRVGFWGACLMTRDYRFREVIPSYIREAGGLKVFLQSRWKDALPPVAKFLLLDAVMITLREQIQNPPDWILEDPEDPYWQLFEKEEHDIPHKVGAIVSLLREGVRRRDVREPVRPKKDRRMPLENAEAVRACKDVDLLIRNLQSLEPQKGVVESLTLKKLLELEAGGEVSMVRLLTGIPFHQRRDLLERIAELGTEGCLTRLHHSMLTLRQTPWTTWTLVKFLIKQDVDVDMNWIEQRVLEWVGKGWEVPFESDWMGNWDRSFLKRILPKWLPQMGFRGQQDWIVWVLKTSSEPGEWREVLLGVPDWIKSPDYLRYKPVLTGDLLYLGWEPARIYLFEGLFNRHTDSLEEFVQSIDRWSRSDDLSDILLEVSKAMAVSGERRLHEREWPLISGLLLKCSVPAGTRRKLEDLWDRHVWKGRDGDSVPKGDAKGADPELQGAELRRHEDLARMFAWGVRESERLLGRPLRIEPSEPGTIGVAEREGDLIRVTPRFLFRDEPDGFALTRAVILHEIGHHLFHFYDENGAPIDFKDLGREGGLKAILNVVMDEHLERRLRSEDAAYGDALQLLASRVLLREQCRVDVNELLRRMPMRRNRWKGLPVRFDIRENKVLMSPTERMQLYPGVEPDFYRFFLCLRLGWGNRYHDPWVAKGLEPFTSRFRSADVRELIRISHMLRKLFFTDKDGKARVRIASLSQINGSPTEQREIDALINREWLRDRVQSLLRGDHEVAEKGEGAIASINLGPEVSFSPIHRVERVEACGRMETVRPIIRGPARRLRTVLQRLGEGVETESRRLRGRALEAQGLRRWLTLGDVRMMRGERRHPVSDLCMEVVIDCSGSMEHKDHMDKAKAFGLLIAAAARGVPGVDARFWGFTHEKILDAGTARDCRVEGLQSDGGNNDAAGLWHASRHALSSRRSRRLLVMISDGMPTACTVESLRTLVRKLEREGFACLQVAVGDLEVECFSKTILLATDSLPVSVRKFGRMIEKMLCGPGACV